MEGTTKRIRPALVVLFAGLAGVALFLSLYGVQVLNPAYTDWLMDGGSLSKGFLGWRLFQGADWRFPPGAMASLGYPRQASIMATDSVPLLAVIGKLLSPLYNESFQYFGWWALVCFLLQGVFGGLISARITRSFWQAVMGSLLFLLSPVLWQNTFFSAGLGGHWVLLAALAPLIYRRELLAKDRLPSVIWGLLGVVSIGVHAQFALVCGIFCVGYCLYGAVENGDWKRLLPLGVFLLAVVIAGWMVGMFSEGGISGVSLFGVSISALWDPHNYSTVLRNLSNPGDYQYAGFAFVGFGMLVLCVLALVWLARSYFSRTNMGKALLDDLRTYRADVSAFAFVFLSCVVLGLAQTIVYLVMTLVISVLAYKMSRKLLTAVLAVCLCLQVYDASTVFQARRMHYGQTVEYTPMAGMEDWNVVARSDVWSTVLISPAVTESVHLAPLAEAIASSGQTLNTLSYSSALDYRNWENAANSPKEDMIFIFTAEELQDSVYFRSISAQIGYLYQWDELVVGFVKPTLLLFPQVQKVGDISFLSRYPIGKNSHLMGGEDIGGIRYIYPGGLSYGPYLTLKPGQYELRVTGDRLDEAGFSFTFHKGEMEPAETSSRPSERVYRLDVSKTVSDFEILIGNSTSQPLYFDALTVTQLD